MTQVEHAALLPVRIEPRKWRRLLIAAAASTLIAAIIVAARLAPRAGIAAALLALGAAGAAVAIRRHQRRRLTELEQLIAQIRKDRGEIQSLRSVQGSLRPLALVLHDVLGELQDQRLRLQQLERQSQLGDAGRNAVLHRKIEILRQQAARDPLTGLFNRRMFDVYLPQAIERCTEGGSDLCLLMMDLDNFKLLNDTFGHAAGDQVLQAVARIIRSTVRRTDLCFRLGGDEFVLVLEGCKAEVATALADRMEASTDELAQAWPLPKLLRLSIGVSSIARLGDSSIQRLLQDADAALYRAKAQHHQARHTVPRRKIA